MPASKTLTHALLVDLISERARYWRARGASNDRVNRYLGRCEVILCRIAARRGEPLPTLYVSKRADGLWLTSWPGTKVARLEERGTARAFRTELTCYRCTIAGRAYIGRGLGEGMYINMRPSTDKPSIPRHGRAVRPSDLHRLRATQETHTIYCPKCHGEYSAHHRDYFGHDDDPFKCCRVNSWLIAR